MTVEQFLRGRGCSHHVLTRLKQTERGILLNGEWAYTNQRLKAGDVLTIRIVEEQSSADLVPVQMPLDIVYEDEDLLVVNKPSDMPIHPSINNYKNTLANGIMYYFTSQGIPFVYRCINRLDRDTSGLLIIAKHYLSAAILSRISAERQIHREYLAIVEGILPESGTINAPIARLDGSVLMRCVDYERGQRAVTHFRRLSACKTDCDSTTQDSFKRSSTASAKSLPRFLSLATVTLETGRTHQIRVHMSHIGHPLIGDFLYNPISSFGRQALHSHKLEFPHPITGEPLSFTCEMPEDMRRVVCLGDSA